MPDPDYLTLRGRLAQAQEELRDAEARVTNAVDAVRRQILMYSDPEDIAIGSVRAAVADLAGERDKWIALRDEISKIKSRLGMP